MQRLLVRIADAHGRLVRTIRLHYHSKPVATIADLRMPENAAKWRLAATVHVRFFFFSVFFFLLLLARATGATVQVGKKVLSAQVPLLSFDQLKVILAVLEARGALE